MSDGNGGWTWVPDPNAAYADPAVWDTENGVRRKLTVAEAAVINPPVTLAQAQAAKIADMLTAAAAAGQTPFAFDFGQAATMNNDGSSGPVAGVKHLQMGAADQTNWMAVMPVALAAVMSQSASPFPIRVQENVTVQPTASQVVACLTAAFARNSGYIVQTLPGLKLQIANATTVAAVEAIGWPSS